MPQIPVVVRVTGENEGRKSFLVPGDLRTRKTVSFPDILVRIYEVESYKKYNSEAMNGDGVCTKLCELI